MNQRPNIVVIMTDQQRADLCRREGYPVDTTPFLDELACQGTWFGRAYTTMPACVPARVSMLTGRWPSATRVRTNYNAGDVVAATDMFRFFRDQGYRTALCGKNHSYLRRADADYWFETGHVGGNDTNERPEHADFDAFAGKMHMHLCVEPTPFPVECQLPYRIVSKAREFVAATQDQPFFLWLSFPEPHNPYQVPEPYYSMFSPESLPSLRAGAEALPVKGFPYHAFLDYAATLNRARANYHGLLRLLDDQIKRFVESVDRTNTVVVFLSDHGDFVGEYGLLRKGPELPDVLTRIPMSFAGPGIARQASRAHVSIADIFPTLREAVGAEIPDGVQGRSLWPLLTGQSYPANEFASVYSEHGFGGLPYDGTETLDPAMDGSRPSQGWEWGGYDCLNSWTQSGVTRMVRKGDWKLQLDVLGRGQLYHLSDDPAELRNRYREPAVADVQRDLLAELAVWQMRTADPLPLPGEWGGRRYVMKRAAHNYGGLP
jgi:arylsulfatase A-like enzyme